MFMPQTFRVRAPNYRNTPEQTRTPPKEGVPLRGKKGGLLKIATIFVYYILHGKFGKSSHVKSSLLV